MADNARISVRVGAHQFEAEGPAELVRAQYDQFVQMVAGVSGRVQRSLPLTLVIPLYSKKPGSEIMLPMIDFTNEGTKRADVLILVLYGYLAFQDQGDVLASDLLKGIGVLKGLTTEESRIDRILDVHSGYVVKSGVKRGSKYALTQTGVDYAESLLVTASKQRKK